MRPTDLTTEWLTKVLDAGTVADFHYDRIGTGQMSECYRVTLKYADDTKGPDSVVLKVAASDETSRQTGSALGLYEREVRFYSEIAPRLCGPLARCYHAAFDPETGFFDLVLDDAAPAQVGDEIRGATVEQALLAVTELARLQGPVLGDQSLAESPWLTRDAPVNQALITGLYGGFVERYADLITPEQREVCQALVDCFDDYLAAEAAGSAVNGIVHGDYRLDNMLFGEPGAERPLTVVDWQTVTWGPALTDLSYFLGCALPTPVRRANYDALLAAYHAALGPDSPLSLDDVREGVRHQSFMGVTMSIIASMVVERTERGDEMFMTMLERQCSLVLDTDALAVLPGPTTPEPLQPMAADETAHPAGDEPLWNESWYFDFADTGQGIGGWVRLGLMPNERVTWINALLSGPDMPTVALLDFEAPVPDDPAEVRTDSLELTHTATDPLRTYRVTVRGRGEAHDDPAALLRGEPGRPVTATFDLTWTTVGVPYQYRIATRYEIPCTVTGTVTVDDRRFELTDVPGQRDHSWGARDWWGMDWVWSALHLDDGSHLHGVDVRIPGVPPIGIGYLQEPGVPLVELQTVTARETFGDNLLPVATTLTMEPGDVTVTIDIQGHAPVLLTSSDGRLSHFPRAWATVRTADGRTGVGWVEWNRVQQ